MELLVVGLTKVELDCVLLYSCLPLVWGQVGPVGGHQCSSVCCHCVCPQPVFTSQCRVSQSVSQAETFGGKPEPGWRLERVTTAPPLDCLYYPTSLLHTYLTDQCTPLLNCASIQPLHALSKIPRLLCNGLIWGRVSW